MKLIALLEANVMIMNNNLHIDKTTSSVIRVRILRKIVHLIFSLFLLIPLTPTYIEIAFKINPNIDPTLFAYTIIALISAIINSIQIKFPILKEYFLQSARESRKRALESIDRIVEAKNISLFIEEIDKLLTKYEEKFFEFLNSIERDYEKRYGYVCITFALVSIAFGYALFRNSIIYGILGLAFIDSFTSIFTELTKGQSRMILKHTVLSILISFTLFTLILLIFIDIKRALILSLSAIMIELISPEDNLTLPFFISYIAYLIGL